MALMFPRLARNFARNGYFPTDEATLERVLQALAPSPSGRMRIFDPCAGEGVALAEAAHALGRESVEACAVEYDRERADHARTLLDRVLHSDLMDTMISRQSFGLLWLNPPYGDLVADQSGGFQYEGKGRRRLEKLFYQRALPLLQYGGVMVLIVPHYVLDDEFAGWIAHHLAEVRVFAAAERTFKQVVIFGIRVKRQDLSGQREEVRSVRQRLRSVAEDLDAAPELPEVWLDEPYRVLPANRELEHFYRLSLEPGQFAQEVRRLGGLWPEFDLHFSQVGQTPRPPVRELSEWHLALALAAGAISGVVRSRTGRTLVLKGDTYKDKVAKSEFTEDEDGNITEVRTLTDRFVPIIRAWDMTPGSPIQGCLLTISSSPAGGGGNDDEAKPGPRSILFDPGNLVMTAGVAESVERGLLNPQPYLERHLAGDWGDLDEADKQTNNQALKHGDRLFSSYDLHDDVGGETRLWIITECDRSVTALLFPSEY
ncbi:DUF6094 domain-containing protein [Azotobacter vinelandii]|uniref:DUF6094 domain-containing protein n=1 Tax=Azotobacter vinelandii TaxID=354 RepID=UPI000922810B|nr:DUF6094 domain-containing protein [Azotobacter vinelandii]WKN23171.1 class I SAM-dependent methyltransferase [Azotobacter vinelandii]SFY09349.1 tRNA1(Val) A37 N6-methylase TrmN6 [Azotobacter vinelandii]